MTASATAHAAATSLLCPTDILRGPRTSHLAMVSGLGLCEATSSDLRGHVNQKGLADRTLATAHSESGHATVAERRELHVLLSARRRAPPLD